MTRQLIGLTWTGSSGFRYCGSLGPIEVADTVRTTLVQIGNVLAERFALVGLFGVDVVVNQQGVWPVEVNPRYTASMELFDWAFGISAVQWHVAACRLGQLSNALPPARQGPLFGKAIVLAARGGVVGHELEELARQRLLNDWPAIADVPQQGTRIEASSPIVTVMAAGRDEQDVLAQLRHKAAAIHSTEVEAG